MKKRTMKKRHLLSAALTLGLLLIVVCCMTLTAYAEEETTHTHNLVHHEAAEPVDCQTPGNIEYWECQDCGEYFSDAEGTSPLNPWFISVTVDCVRPEGVADCATVTCEVCGNDIYGAGEHDTGVAACQDGTCSKCGDEITGYGCANYDTPACGDGVCYYCGSPVAGFGHENGAWAPCQVGECSYGCGLTYPATAEHADEDADDYCDTCWSHLAHDVDPCVGGECSICWTYVEGAHNYVGAETVAPTCNEAGEMTYTCSACGVSYTEEIPAYHNGNLEYHPATEAIDCAHPGNIENWYCPGCGEYFADADAGEILNPWFISITVDCVRPEDVADCATVTCEVCGNDIYGSGDHDTGVALCQDGTCSKCGDEVTGYGCANYDTPACGDGVCYYCGGFVAGLGHENGAWAPCLVGECAYGCGLQYEPTGECVDEDGSGQCDNCWFCMGEHTFDNGFDPVEGGTCTVCWNYIAPEAAASDVTATFKTIAVSLGQALSFGYNVQIDGEFTTAIMKFVLGDSVLVSEVEGVYNEATGRYLFKLTGINPQCIGDNILAEVYVDGVKVAERDGQTVKAYLVGQLDKETSTDALKTLIYNTLAYGAAAQVYTGYKTDDMINAGYEDMITNYVLGDATGADQGFTNNNTLDDVKFSGVSVNFGDVNKIMVQFIGDATLYVNGNAVAAQDMAYDAATGKYTYYTEGIYASELGRVYTFTLQTDDGATVSTLTYSVNAYSARQQGKDTDNAKLAFALFNYGMAAKAYIG